MEVLTGGYQKRVQASAGSIGAAAKAAAEAEVQAESFASMAAQEDAALPVRLRVCQAGLDEAVEKERELQERYARLVRERNALAEALARAAEAAK